MMLTMIFIRWPVFSTITTEMTDYSLVGGLEQMAFPCQLQCVDYLAQSEEPVILLHGHTVLIWEQGDDLVS